MLLMPVPEHATQFPEEEGRGRLIAGDFLRGSSGGLGISGLPPFRTFRITRYDKSFLKTHSGFSYRVDRSIR